MKDLLKSTLKYTMFLTLAGVLLYVAFNGYDINKVLIKWNEANKLPIILSGIAVLLSHFFRALRWKLLLNPMGFTFSTINSYLSVLVGYGVNIIVPRGGEVSRCINLNKLEGVPVKQALGTVIAERIIDLLFLIGSIGLALIVSFDQLLAVITNYLNQIGNKQNNGTGNLVWMLVIGLLLFVPALLFVLKSQNRTIIRFRIKIKQFFIGLGQGIMSIFRLQHNILFLVYTILIWGLYFIMAYFVIIAFPETKELGLEGALMVFVLGAIAMAMPSPGGTGTYHVFVPLGIFMLYGIPKDDGLAFATIFHGWQTAIHLIVGGITIVISQILIKRNAKKNS
tara:strand:- start:1116 stop:2129 length:1014 start_codon:yes stop_codon:yes gene_type:complete